MQAWQLAATCFFLKNLSPQQQKYSAYDRELLAIYEVVKHFHCMLEAHQFTTLNDHKPLIYAFLQKSNSLSPCQFWHLDFISQFAMNLEHLSGLDNVVADALSWINSISNTIDFTSLMQSQQHEDELCQLLQSDTSLRLQKIPIPGVQVKCFKSSI